MNKTIPSVFVLILSVLDLKAATINSINGNLRVEVLPEGSYSVTVKEPNWTLQGKLASPAADIAVVQAHDPIGSDQEISFTYSEAGHPIHAVVRLYGGNEVIGFEQIYPEAVNATPPPFPDFTSLPQGLIPFSYGQSAFAPPGFQLQKISTPWLFFDAADHAMILSPASHFMAACMIGDGQKEAGCGFNANLKAVPAGTIQKSLLVVATGINHTWDAWGQALTSLQGKKRPTNDADVFLKYYGYWTDNGAAYWYDYDRTKGYQGTLEAIIDDYRTKQIPLHYLQLDSWWYHKTLTNPGGNTEMVKNSKLPEGDWNRYGGTIEYKAHPFVFPQGMEAFHEKVGVPFMTHNRWIDPTSPYHAKYRISGIAAIDAGFWNEIADYLKDNGVIGYEQDWLSEIFRHSPELSSTLDTGDQFLDNMASACSDHGLSIQYCMAFPCMFMEGSKYANLTSIRCSEDRFEPRKYHNFLYTSRLACSMGIWPWTDVFRSAETNNLLIGTLSAGPVGTGDALGQENKENLFKAMRADGVIIKPDAPLLPTDASYITEGQKQDLPLVATTYTNHGGIRTVYGMAIKRSKTEPDTVSIPASDLNVVGAVYLYDYFAGTGTKVNSGEPLGVQFHGQNLAFFIAAPISSNGIAFLGDEEKFVGTGKMRVPSLKNQGGKLTAELLLAAQETGVTLHGYAVRSPQVFVQGGDAGPIQFDAATGYFTVVVKPDVTLQPKNIEGESVRKLKVTFAPS
jgi:hypothetical protein